MEIREFLALPSSRLNAGMLADRMAADQSGFLFDQCYNILESPDSPIAHKAYAMTILYNISEMEPGLKPELIRFLESCERIPRCLQRG